MTVTAAPLRVALAGVGVVGAQTLAILQRNAALIEQRAGRPIIVTALSGRNRNKTRMAAHGSAAPRPLDLSAYRWESDCTALATADDVDVVVEVIGGADGIALTLARQVLAQGKGLVTANKAMLAMHGLELAAAAEQAQVALKYEAAVAGGVPIIKALRESASANVIERVYGILNGTCNYILTKMESDGIGFAEALAEAQKAGFAEADPSTDINGIDAAHKLAILAALSFGTRPDFNAVAVEGIANISAADIRKATERGYHLRLVGMASYRADSIGATVTTESLINRTGDSQGSGDSGGSGEGRRLYQAVQPCLVPRDHPLASVPRELNAVVVEGDCVGQLFFQGKGAGGSPTASAIVADLVDIARGESNAPPFAIATHRLVAAQLAKPRRIERLDSILDW